MIGENEVFDLWKIMMELVGDVNLFIILGMILIIFNLIKASAKFEVTMMIVNLFLLIVYAETKIITLYLFVIFYSGTVFYYNLVKKVS